MTQIKPCDVLLIDGFSLLYRAYYGYPNNLTAPNGIPINAAYGFMVMMVSAIEQFKPNHVGICLDRKEPTYRHALYSQYKANRSAPDDEFLIQIPEFRSLIQPFQIPLVECAGYESDDLLGALSVHFTAMNLTTYIMSGDLDLLQLVNDSTYVVSNKKGVSNYIIYDESEMMNRYGLTPTQFIDFKALKGDASDNIPGVKGIGEKTATKLLSLYHSLDGIYQHLDDISSAAIQHKLTENRDMAYTSKALVTIVLDAPVSFDDMSFDWAPNWPDVFDVLHRYQFKRLIATVQDMSGIHPIPIDDIVNGHGAVQQWFVKETAVQMIDSIEMLDHLIPLLTAGFSVDFGTTSSNPYDAELVAISITPSAGLSFVIDCRYQTNQDSSSSLFDGLRQDKAMHPFVQHIIPMLESPDIPKILHNAKYDYQVLACHGIHLRGIYFDTMIAAYVLDSRQSLDLKSLVKRMLDVDMTPVDEFLANTDAILDVPVSDVAAYVADDSNMIHQLYQALTKKCHHDQQSLLNTIEFPLISVLADMECHGVQCDMNYLGSLSREYSERLLGFEQSIYALAGTDAFNINSPKQLADVLFDRLGLPVIKKTKTARSTDSTVLETLAKDYDIASLILTYRLYKKLISTYIDALPKMVQPKTQKIHASFNQAVTATGRLSSNQPNLQNIPVRTNEGQRIRRAFISRFNHGCIISIDYSQIELRVLAHLANDPAMIAAFQNGHDIHQATAAKIFDVTYDSVSNGQREQAKKVNFGITYGQSAFALAGQLSMSRSEAQTLIDHYFSEFSTVRTFMTETISTTRNHGFVTTMFGRIRYIDAMDSPNRSAQQNAHRIAINTRVQGSAADIMKMAMIQVAHTLSDYQSNMVMQVHDELVLDVHPSEKDAVCTIIPTVMEGITDLRVPLTVDVECGDNWGAVMPI